MNYRQSSDMDDPILGFMLKCKYVLSIIDIVLTVVQNLPNTKAQQTFT